MVLVPQSASSIDDMLREVPHMQAARWESVFDFSHKHKRTFTAKVRSRLDAYAERAHRRRWQGTFREWFFGPLATWNRAIASACREFNPDVVILEHTRHAATLPFVRRVQPDALLVVNSHNVESALIQSHASSMMPSHRAQMIAARIERYERRLNDWCDVLWACSKADVAKYRALGVRKPDAYVVPNGVDTSQVHYRRAPQADKRCILFAGTLCYEPNEQGVLWFYEHVWPLVKQGCAGVRWRLVGRAPTARVRALAADPSIDLIADAPSMAPHLDDVHVGICPLFAGSGTRLKLLEAFSAGIPTVTTDIGAEGLEVVHGFHVLISNDPSRFAGHILALLRDRNEADRLRKNARFLAETEYEWTTIIDRAGRCLKETRTSGRPLTTSRTLLR